MLTYKFTFVNQKKVASPGIFFFLPRPLSPVMLDLVQHLTPDPEINSG